MLILVACEYSGVIRDAFRDAGHEAYSCDLRPTEGRPEYNQYHYQCDVRQVLDRTQLITTPGYATRQWDLLIAHPVCRVLTNSGVHWLVRGGQRINPQRWEDLKEGAAFFKLFLDAPIPRICVENPIMHKYAKELIGRKQDQSIQPFHHGHTESKSTCLWLKNLPKLKPTKVMPKPECGYWDNQTPSGQNKLGPGPDREKIRSKTYPGIAKAMVEQWGTLPPL